MDKPKARLLLQKVNSLFKTVDANPAGASALERDLMLSYLRQFYEIVALSPIAPTIQASLDTPAKVSTVQVSEAQPLRDNRDQANAGQMAQETLDHQSEEAPPVLEEAARFAFLFEWHEPGNLAERLASQAISHLSMTTFTVNEKLLYTNDLFGRLIPEMEEAVRTLNQCSHFEQAKALLSHLAERYSWDQGERREVAKNFIHTVRRRFL